MKKINWGIIGCGDVTELKSGPAFSNIQNSSLVAVMRRDAGKAEDYAKRHNVPRWYNNASDLINDADVNAVYVATPPSSHEEYTLAALHAGKPVYVEKPISTNLVSALNMAEISRQLNVKLVVAHYRRGQHFFKKIKQLLIDTIGEVRFAKVELFKRALSEQELLVNKNAWRVNKNIAGGGLFHDLAPHQLDLAYYFFGEIENAEGYSLNQANLYDADDIVTGNILFKSGVLFSGTWCFNVDEQDERDTFEIIGSKGRIAFSVFENSVITVTKNNKSETIFSDKPAHVQQPMIEEVVAYFLNKGPNPCSAEEGAKVMQVMEQFTNR